VFNILKHENSVKVQWIFIILLSLFVIRNFKGTCSSVACRGGGEQGATHGHPRQGGIQRVKFKKFECCNLMIFPIVRLQTHATWI